MVDKRVIARERGDRSNLAQITGLLRLRLAMTASDFSIIVKNIAIFQQSHIIGDVERGALSIRNNLYS